MAEGCIIIGSPPASVAQEPTVEVSHTKVRRSPALRPLIVSNVNVSARDRGRGSSNWLSRRVLTSLVRLQLSLQVFGGHVKVLILSVSGPRFTSPAAAVTAAAQAAAEVAAGGQAADDKQSLQAEDPGVSTLNKTWGKCPGSREALTFAHQLERTK